MAKQFSLDGFALLLLTATLPIPLFVVLVDSGLTLAPLLVFERGVVRPRFGFPIALLPIGFVCAVWLLRFLQGKLQKPNWNVLAFAGALVAWMTVALIYGLTVGNRPIMSFALYAQALLPIFMLMLAMTLPAPAQAVRRALLLVPVVSSISVMVIFAMAAYLFSSYTVHQGWSRLAEAFYSIKNVHPAIITTALAVLFAQIASAKRDLPAWAIWTMLMVNGAYLLINWSRTGLVSIVLVTLLWVIHMTVRAWKQRSLLSIPATSAAVILAAFIVSSLTFAGVGMREAARLPPKTPAIVDVEKNGDYGDGVKTDIAPDPFVTHSIEIEENLGELAGKYDQRRLKLLILGLQRVVNNPLVGDAFVPLTLGSEVAGRPSRGNMFPSHNQFVDIALRAGAPALLLYLTLLGYIGLTCFRAYRAAQGTFVGEMAICSSFLLAAILAGSMFQSYLILTQPAALLFVILGLAIRTDTSRQDHVGA